MARLLHPDVAFRLGPVTVSLDRGGLVPILAFAGLFVEIALRTGISPIAAGLVGASAGTASLLAHEVGHTLAARSSSGVRPVGISLVWLGAATRLEGAYQRGGDQAKVALAGPVASFAVAGAVALTLLAPLPREARYLVAALVVLNLTLGAVNLLPAKPLDGYNAVVGLLWAATGSDVSARRALRRVAFAWAPFELVGTSVTLVKAPFFGTLVLATIAALLAQRLYVRFAAT